MIRRGSSSWRLKQFGVGAGEVAVDLAFLLGNGGVGWEETLGLRWSSFRYFL